MSTVSADLMTAVSAALSGSGAGPALPSETGGGFDEHLSRARADAAPAPGAGQPEVKTEPAEADAERVSNEEESSTTKETGPTEGDSEDAEAEADSPEGDETLSDGEPLPAEAVVAETSAAIAVAAEEIPAQAPVAAPPEQTLGGGNETKAAARPSPAAASRVPVAQDVQTKQAEAAVVNREAAQSSSAQPDVDVETPRKAAPLPSADKAASPGPKAEHAALKAERAAPAEATAPRQAQAVVVESAPQAAVKQPESTRQEEVAAPAPDAPESPELAPVEPSAQQSPVVRDESPAAKRAVAAASAASASGEPAAAPAAVVATVRVAPGESLAPAAEEPRQKEQVAERIEMLEPAKPAVAASPAQRPDAPAALTPAEAPLALPSPEGEQGLHVRQAEQARFAQRVSRAFEAVGHRNGSVRLKLSPPELGSLRLEVVVHQGALSARLEAETPAARSLLLESLPLLRERLAQQEIRVERFDVDLMDRNPGGSPQQSGGQPDPGRAPARRVPSAAPSQEADTSRGAESRAAAGGESSHLNVVI